MLNPTYTLNPSLMLRILYTQYPITYTHTLYPIPYTLYPIPYTLLYPKPYTQMKKNVTKHFGNHIFQEKSHNKNSDPLTIN